MDLWVVENPRIGSGYIFDDGLEVLRISFGFPFLRNKLVQFFVSQKSPYGLLP